MRVEEKSKSIERDLELIKTEEGYKNFEKKLERSKGEITISFLFNRFISKEAISLVAKAIGEKAKMPVHIYCTFMPLERVMSGLLTIVKQSKVPLEFDALGSYNEEGREVSGPLLGYDQLTSLIQAASYPIILKLQSNIDPGGRYFTALKDAADKSDVPVKICFVLSSDVSIKNKAFIAYEIVKGAIAKAAKIMTEEAKITLLEEESKRVEKVKAKLLSKFKKDADSAEVPVKINCRDLSLTPETMELLASIVESAKVPIIFDEVTQDSFWPIVPSYKMLRGYSKLVTLISSAKYPVSFNLLNTMNPSSESFSNLKEAAKKSEVPVFISDGVNTIKNKAFIAQESAENSVGTVVSECALDVDTTKEEAEAASSKTDSGDDNDKPDDSAGGGAVRAEKEESKAVSVFLSSEPELLNLRPEELTQNETKEEREYRESVEAVEEGLVYEVQRVANNSDVVIDNSTEDVLPYIQDVPVTKISGGLTISQEVSS